jgi:hypothetical protein
MSTKSHPTILIGAVVSLLALSVLACGSLPISLAFLQPTSTPMPTETPTPESTVSTPVVPSGNPPRRASAAQALQALLKNSGLQGGIVTVNDGNALGLRLGRTTSQIQVASNAIVVVPGRTNATLSDIAVGDRVIARDSTYSTNATASMVLDIPAKYTTSNLMLGAVVANKNGVLTLRARSGTHTVTSTPSTVIVNISGANSTLDGVNDLIPASAVLVIGDESGNAFNSQVIVLLDKNAQDLLNRARKNVPTPTPTL